MDEQMATLGGGTRRAVLLIGLCMTCIVWKEKQPCVRVWHGPPLWALALTLNFCVTLRNSPPLSGLQWLHICDRLVTRCGEEAGERLTLTILFCSQIS